MKKPIDLSTLHRNLLVKAIPWLIICIMPVIYWLLCRQFTGPAYLADEIGYLSKASFLGGYQVDGSSSYHPGFSLILAPLFIFLSTTTKIWQGVLIINASLWGLSFFVLWELLTKCTPKSNFWERVMALIFASLYPAFATMSGYAFPSSLLTLIFLCSLITLSRWKPGEILNLLPFTLSVGIFYWVHPTGLAVVLASTTVVGLLSYHVRRFLPLIIHVLLLLCLIFSSNYFINWMNKSMTPSGYSVQTHYASLTSLLASIGAIKFWATFLGIVLGQISYLVVSSFGIILFTISEWTRLWINSIFNERTSPRDSDQTPLMYTILALFFIILMGSWGFATSSAQRIDHMIYGRYSESLLLPLLAFGFLSFRNSTFRTRCKYAIVVAMFFGLSGIVIDQLLPRLDALLISNNNLVNTPSFWPQYLTNFSSYLLWFGIGGLGILIVALGGKYIALLFMVLSFAISFSGQAKWHKGVLDSYSNPSSFVDIIRSNFVPGTCVGFDNQSTKTDSQYKNERFNLYQFYLYDFNYQRMTPDEWFSNCNGPYLSYYVPQFVDKEQAKLIARENASGLFLIIKNQDSELIVTDKVIKENDLSLSMDFGPNCIVSGCFVMKATQLTNWTQVGTLQGNSLLTSSQNGFLFYGPYTQLAKGKYFLVLNGILDNVPGAILDITSDGAQVVHLVAQLSDYEIEDSSPLVIPFEISEDVQNLEVRLRVSELDTLGISDYKIILQQESTLLPTKHR